MQPPTPALLVLAMFLGPVPAQSHETPVKKPEAPREEPLPRHAALDQILKTFVREGLVDYAGIRLAAQKELTAYLDGLATVAVDKLPRLDQFATYINLYNATMIRAVLDKTAKDAKWTPAAKDFGVFKEPLVRLASGTITLNDLENQVIRPRFQDLRIHVALVCGAHSCPPLLARAYEGLDLDRVLTDNLATFLHDSARNVVDRASKTVRLSRLFDWYKDDFGGEAGVRTLLTKHFDPEVATFRIEYLDYSWDLNAQRAPKDK